MSGGALNSVSSFDPVVNILTKKKTSLHFQHEDNMPFKDVPQDVKFPEEEEKTLKYWDDIDAFQESLR